jgi:hypothetical protein
MGVMIELAVEGRFHCCPKRGNDESSETIAVMLILNFRLKFGDGYTYIAETPSLK